ncbi:MAG: ribosome maturation factor RimP [Firmicutes bacterium]|nr:ribosome maturation factor RimP [Bacillota bacterium]
MTKIKTFCLEFNHIEELVWKLAEPLVFALGCELIDVEYIKEAGYRYLRIFIDREQAVDHDCCQEVSECLSGVLDQADFIDQSYFLEVSSPGLNRQLKREKDFLRYKGREIAVYLYAPWQGQKELYGVLYGLTENAICIEREERSISVPQELVAKVQLVEL